MSALLRLYPGDELARLALIVLSQVTLVMLLALAGTLALRKRAAAVRYGICFAALVCLFLGPLAIWVADTAGLRLVAVPLAYLGPAEQPVVDTEPVMGGAEMAVSDVSRGAQAVSSPGVRIDRMRVAVAGAFVVWCAGAGFLLFRLVYGLGVAGALRRSLRPVKVDGLEDVIGAAREALGTPRLPRLMRSPIVSSPISLGILKPVVVVPERLLETVLPGELRDVLVHEYAHVAHRDHLVGLLQRVAAMLFWLHPLVHVLNRELARAREEMCDNYVLRQGHPTRYARTLLALAQRPTFFRRVPHGAGLLHARWRLADRITGLLDARRRLTTRMSGWLLSAATLVFFTAGVLVAGCRLSAAHESEAVQPAASEPAPRETGERRLIAAGVPLEAIEMPGDEERQHRVTIRVKADGTYVIDGVACDAAGVDERLGEIASASREVFIAVYADDYILGADGDLVEPPLDVLSDLFKKHGLGMSRSGRRIKYPEEQE